MMTVGGAQSSGTDSADIGILREQVMQLLKDPTVV